MEKYVIATNQDGVIFGDYFTEIMSKEEAEQKLVQVRKADPNAKLMVVIGKEETINADKESSC